MLFVYKKDIHKLAVYEFGLGSPDFSVTAGSGETISRSEILGNIGRGISGAIYDLVN